MFHVAIDADSQVVVACGPIGTLVADDSITLIDSATAAAIGALWDGEAFVEPEPVDPPLPRLLDLTPRQFMSGLWNDGIITFEQCDAFLSVRTIPAPLQALLEATLADDDTGEVSPRKAAIILIKGASTFVFTDPLVDVIRQAQGWTVEHLRERWADWATL